MEKMSNEQILAFANEFADRIYEIGWYPLDEEAEEKIMEVARSELKWEEVQKR